LSYDSGSGSGPFGWGWTVSTPAIARKTEKDGLPRYLESDVFVLSGHEDLVSVREPDGRLFQDRKSAPGSLAKSKEVAAPSAGGSGLWAGG
jgi:hypothetical protein